MKKEVSGPVMVAALVIVVALVGVFLFKAATGGQQGNGRGQAAAPPGQMQMMRQMQQMGKTVPPGKP